MIFGGGDMASDYLVALLKNQVVAPHGVVNVRAVLDELTRQHRDPTAELVALFHDPQVHEWRYYALVGLRALAAQGRLTAQDARALLAMTDAMAPYAGVDEYYKSISALAVSPQTAPVLLDFIWERLARKTPEDWRWLAFAAVGALLDQGTAKIPQDLAKALRDEASNELDRHRRVQLEETADAALKAN